MRHLLLVVAMLLTGSIVSAQTQRMVFLEAYSNASCGPCAAQNPTYNALTNSAGNSTKVVKLKYQTNWPGTDPMNAQTQSEVQPRVDYYGVDGVPMGFINGQAIPGTPQAYEGAVAALTQAQIDSAYAVQGPLGISVTHTLSADFDSVYITVTVTGAQDTTFANALVVHVAMVEKHIEFATPPGSNGETDFYYVMRKMVPSVNGSALQAAWTNGGTQVFTFGAAIPAYIYDMAELAIVGFIQNNTSKAVLNAGISQPIPFAVDARANALSGLPALTCANVFNVSVEFKNNGSSALTAADLEVRVDGNLATTFNWTGNLAAGATTTQNITNVPVTGAGTHNVSVMVVAAGDPNTANNVKTGSFAVASTPTAAPLVQGFATAAFPPANWAISNPDGDATWIRNGNGGFQASAGSAKMDFFNASAGTEDILYAAKVDLSQSSNTNARITFSHAYAQYQNENDQLAVEVSTDCGASWTTVWSKAGGTLATVPAQTSGFTPSLATHWVRDTASLAVVFGEADVLIRFQAVSDFGNNLYVDDINIETFTPVTVGSNDVFQAEAFNLYPNPATATTTLKFGLLQANDVNVQVVNALGQEVMNLNPGRLAAGVHSLDLNVNTLPNGTYFVKVMAGTTLETRTLVVNR